MNLDRILQNALDAKEAGDRAILAAAEYSANAQARHAQLLAGCDELMGEVERVMAALAGPREPVEKGE